MGNGLGIFFFFAELGFELWASACLAGALLLMPHTQPFFTLGILEMGLAFSPRSAHFMLPAVAGMTPTFFC
jgi:hypothetical protein